jgi:rhodanese-related sulfurtransferase
MNEERRAAFRGGRMPYVIRVARAGQIVKLPRKFAFVWLITIYLLNWVAAPSSMAGEKPSATPAKPLTGDPKEMGGKVELIAAEELKKLIDENADITVVDTQDERIFQVKHIKGAINFPWAPVIREPITLPRTKLLIIYCGCAGEEASKSVAQQLISNWGFKRIKVLDGGFSQWLRLGYPTQKGEQNRHNGRSPCLSRSQIA